MAHLDLRPANIFLTTATGYRYCDMDSRDPQRLQVLVAQGYNANPIPAGSVPAQEGEQQPSLFARVLGGAALQQRQGSHPGGNSSGGSAGLATNARNEFSDYDVRKEVERLLVRRKYEIRVGDLGHCCRPDEKSCFEVPTLLPRALFTTTLIQQLCIRCIAVASLPVCLLTSLTLCSTTTHRRGRRGTARAS
jgi:hypothetical protein